MQKKEYGPFVAEELAGSTGKERGGGVNTKDGAKSGVGL